MTTKRGFGIVAIIVAVSVMIVVGATVATVYPFMAKNDRKLAAPQQHEQGNNNFGQLGSEESKLAGDSVSASPSPKPTPSPNATSGNQQTLYTQPQGLYVISLPDGWVVNSTFATNNYSTTKFTSVVGSISITFGTGKDPNGGCSEASLIALADRNINGCYLLQKDGSRILNRAYTETASKIQITIEAYINPPLAQNQSQVVSIIKTIGIK